MKIGFMFMALLLLGCAAHAAPPLTVQIWLPNHAEVSVMPFTEGMKLMSTIATTGEFFMRFPKAVIITRGECQQRVSTEPILQSKLPDPSQRPGDIITFPVNKILLRF